MTENNWGDRSQRLRIPTPFKKRLLTKYPLCGLDMPNICTTKATEVDHIIPVAEGGTNDRDNLMTVCPECHAIKSKEEANRGKARAAARSKHPGEEHPAYRYMRTKE